MRLGLALTQREASIHLSLLFTDPSWAPKCVKSVLNTCGTCPQTSKAPLTLKVVLAE